uniref:calcium-binding protein n=1 Tax=Dongia deserti TaxID=2268030 RepID=UPI000E651E1B
TNALAHDAEVSDDFTIYVKDGTDGEASTIVSFAISGTNDANAAPIINAPGLLYWSDVNDGNMTPINRVSFQDVDSTIVQVTLQMDDPADLLTAAGIPGVVAVVGSGTATITLSGTIDAINAFLFSGAVQWNPALGNNQETGTLTVTIDDHVNDPVSTTISIAEFQPSFGGASTVDLSSVNLNDIDTDPNAGNSNDVLTTSWSHQPSTTTVVYDGGDGTDTVTLVFTPDQLAEILANTTFQNDLRAYFDGNPTGDVLDLDSSSWNADVQNFEAAHISLATGYGVGTYSIDSFFNPLPPADTSPDADTDDDLVIGTAGGDLLTGGAGSLGLNGDDVLVGLAGDDSLGGGSGNDLLLGGDGSDTLTGGTGIDVLAGGRGGDTYVLKAGDNTVANADLILDYSYAEGDKIDLSDLLDANFDPGDDLTGFVRLQQSGSDIVVQVDTDGGGDGFQTVATLVNYGTAGADPVRLTFESADHALAV